MKYGVTLSLFVGVAAGPCAFAQVAAPLPPGATTAAIIENGYARCQPHMRRDPSKITAGMHQAQVEAVPFIADDGFSDCLKIREAWKAKKAAQNSQAEKDAIAAIAAKIGN